MVSESLALLFAELVGLEQAEPELGPKLASLVREARAAWPKIAVDAKAFVAHVADHALRSDAPARYLDGVHGSDLYLACGVCLRDRAALTYFEEHFMAKVPEYVLRVRIGRDVVDDVQQKLREHLVMGPKGVPKIAEYSGKGALGGWLRVAAVRAALNQIRDGAASNPDARGGEAAPEELAVGGDPELAFVKEHARDLLGDAFRRVIAGLEAKERTMLRLHYLDGLTMDQLATLYKMPRSTVARRIVEVRQQVLETTETLLRDERRLSASAVASVIREARSQLHVTISRLFQ